jgi:hypothetical protein
MERERGVYRVDWIRRRRRADGHRRWIRRQDCTVGFPHQIRRPASSTTIAVAPRSSLMLPTPSEGQPEGEGEG